MHDKQSGKNSSFICLVNMGISKNLTFSQEHSSKDPAVQALVIE